MTPFRHIKPPALTMQQANAPEYVPAERPSAPEGRNLMEGVGSNLVVDQDDIPELTWLEAGQRAVKNTPESGAKFVTDMWTALSHPIETGGTLVDIASGAIKLINGYDGDPDEEKAKQVGAFFADRYGTIKGFKRAFASDPVGIIADFSTVLTAGSALAVRAPALAGKLANVSGQAGGLVRGAGDLVGKLGTGMGAAGRVIDPINAAGRVGKLAVKKVAGPVYHNLSGMLSGLGPKTGAQAYTAGKQGSKGFYDNLRSVPGAMDSMVGDARQALLSLKIQKNATYAADMKHVAEASTPIAMGPIDEAFRAVAARGSFKGVEVNKASTRAFKEMADILDEWRGRDPVEFHTPIGMDALKQKLHAVKENFSMEEKTARSMVDNVFHAVRAEIVKAAPKYGDVMKAYEAASDEIANMERSLGLGKKMTSDRALRALTSSNRNNVNTNYGARGSLVDKLQDAGGASELQNKIAGAAATSWTPRGIQGATAPASAAGIGFLLGPEIGIPLAAMSSPRLIGEVNAAAGRFVTAAKRLGDSDLGTIANRLQKAARIPAYQAGKLEEDLRRKGY